MSNLQHLKRIYTFDEAQKILGNKTTKKLCYVTYLVKRDVDTIAVLQHSTDILTYERNGNVTYNTGGWHTPTTKQRLADIGPIGNIWQHKHIWYFNLNNKTYGYSDGMVVTVTNESITVTGAIEDTEKEKKAKNKLDRKIKKFVSLYVQKLLDGKIDRPSSGDCMLCAMRDVKTNESWGDSTKDFSHIESHISENYFVPSLLINAIKFKNVSPIARHVIGEKMFKNGMGEKDDSNQPFEDIAREQITRSLLSYIRHMYDSAQSIKEKV